MSPADPGSLARLELQSRATQGTVSGTSRRAFSPFAAAESTSRRISATARSRSTGLISYEKRARYIISSADPAPCVERALLRCVPIARLRASSSHLRPVRLRRCPLAHARSLTPDSVRSSYFDGFVRNEIACRGSKEGQGHEIC